MRKTLLALFLLLLFLKPSPSLALCDSGRTGPKIAANTNETWLHMVRQLYNEQNPGCTDQRIPVTILLFYDHEVKDYVDTLSRMQSRNLRPIIRIASTPLPDAWTKISEDAARTTAEKLNEAFTILRNQGKEITDAIVYFGNEPNLATEWENWPSSGMDPGTIRTRLEDFTRSFKAFAQKSKEINAPYAVFIPPLALHLSTDLSTEQGWLADIILPQVAPFIDGAALTIYEPNANYINQTYNSMKTFYSSQKGINRLIASEVGLFINGGPAQEPCYLELWEQTMTSLFQMGNSALPGAEVINTSFFEDIDCDHAPESTLLAVIAQTGQTTVYLPFNNNGTPNAMTLKDFYLSKPAESYKLTTCCDGYTGQDGDDPGGIPDEPTNWGDPVPSQDVPCQPLEINPGDADYIAETSWPRPFPGSTCTNLAALNAQGEVTRYCLPSPLVGDTVHIFPNASDTTIAKQISGSFSFSISGSQIPFLGNSSTSPTYLTDSQQRMSLNLTDYLRGLAYYDQKRLSPDNPSDYQRLLSESGVIRKIYPYLIVGDTRDQANIAENAYSQQWRKHYILCRLFSIVDPEGIPCDDMLPRTDPVHDYQVLPGGLLGNGLDLRLAEFICGNSGFNNIQVIKKTCSEISQYLTPITKELRFPHSETIFGTGLGGGLENPWIYRFPLTSKDDLPALVDIAFESYDPVGDKTEIQFTRHSISEMQGKAEASGGSYQYSIFKDPHSDPPLYESHLISLIYLPHIAEATELAQWAGDPYTPAGLNWQEDDQINQVKLPNDLFCNVNQYARGGAGDVIAGDGTYSTLTLTNYQREDAINSNPDGQGFPERQTLQMENRGQATIYLPLLNTLAKRTIGQGGLFSSRLPAPYIEKLNTQITEFTKDKVNPWEFPAYGPAIYSYDNDLTDYNNDEQWGCTKDPDTQECLTDSDGNIIPAPFPNHEISGSGGVNGSDARLYFPYLGAVEIFWKSVQNHATPNQLVL